MMRFIFLFIAVCLGVFSLVGCGSAGDEEINKVGEEVNKLRNDYKVIVVGAGIAGLTAAWYLNDDYEVKVLEKNDRVGGRTITGIHKGFSYAKGTEYLGKPDGTLEKIINDLGIETKEIPSPSDALYHNGTTYYGEDGIALQYINESSLSEYNRFISTILGVYKAYEHVPEFNLNSDLEVLDDITVGQWFDENDFPDIFYDTYNVGSRGLFGANINEISALSYISEIAFDYEDSEQIVSIDDLENSSVQGEEKTEMYTFMTGITEVTEALAKNLGDSVQLNSTVTSITKGDNGYTVTYIDTNETSHTYTSDLVILAVPAPIALKLAPTILGTEQKTIMEQISYSPFITVALFSENPIFNKAFDLAVPDNYFFTDVYDSTWVQRYYDTSLQNKEDSVMSVYIAPESYKDEILFNMADDELLKRVYQDLEKIYPDVENKITGSDIHRFEYAYPVMTQGAYKRLSRLHEITEGSFLLAGDYMIYPTFEAALESGFLAYELALEELK